MNKYLKQIQASFATKLMLALLILLGSSTAAMAGVTASIKDFSIAKGETKTVAIQIDNDDASIRGFQGDVYLSLGLEFVKFQETDAYASIDKSSEGRWTSKHMVTSTVRNDLDGKPLRFAVVAMSQGKYLKGTSGDVVTFQVRATNDLPDEGATIELKDSKADNYELSAKATVSNSEYAPAKVEMSVDDIVLNVGEAITLPINLDNESAITGVQATVTLPEGLEFVKNEDDDVFSTTARCTDHMATDKGIADGSATMLLWSISSAALKGSTGAVATFTVKSNEKFVQDCEISFTKVKAVTPLAKTYPIPDFKVKVVCIGANIVFSADDIEIVPTETKKISINLSNYINLSAVQGSVILPKGLSIVPNDEDEFFSLTERATDTHMIDGRQIDGGYSFMLYSLASNNLKGNDGSVISFTVKANSELAANSTIKFTNLVSVTSSAVKFTSNDFEIEVSNTSYPAEVEAQAVIDSLSKAFDDAKAVVDQYSETVQSRVADIENEIASDIAGLQTLLNEAKANGAGVAALASINAEKKTISESITGYLTDAAAKEEAWQANEETNKSLVAGIAKVEAEFNSVSQIVSAYRFLASEDVRFKSAQEKFNASQTKIIEAIANAKSAAEEAYKAESSVKSEADILALLADIENDIKSFQKFAETQENLYILTSNLDKIAVVEGAYNDAVSALEAYPFYSEKFDGYYEEISAMAANAKTAIDSLEVIAKAVSDAESATTQEEFDNALAAALELVNAIIPAAKDAEAKYQEYLANEEMYYKSFTEKIAALETANAEAVKKVAALSYMSSNDAAYAEAQAATNSAEENILKSIADAKAKAQASFEAGTAVKDEADMIALFTSIDEAIKKYVSDAQIIEAKYQVYLNEAMYYASFTEKIAALETANAEAVKKVAALPYMSSNDAAYVEAQAATNSAEEDILKSIADAKAKAQASFEAGTAVKDEADMIALFTSIDEAIKKYVSDAQIIEAKYQASTENEAMYLFFNMKITDLENANAEAVKKVTALPYMFSNNAAYAKAQAATDAAEENILKSIADAKAKAQASYEAGTAVKDETAMTALFTSIDKAIKKYVSDAESIEAKFEAASANEAMYASFNAKIAELESANKAAVLKVSAFGFMASNDAKYVKLQASTNQEEEVILKAIDYVKVQAKAAYDDFKAVEMESVMLSLLSSIEEDINEYLNNAESNERQFIDNNNLDKIAPIQAAYDKAVELLDSYSFYKDKAYGYEAVSAKLAEAEAALETLKAMAAAVTDPKSSTTQADFDKAVAEAQAFVADFASATEEAQANYVAYEAVSANLDEVQAALDAVKAEVATYEPSVQESLADEIAALQKKITVVSGKLVVANKSMSVPAKADSMIESLNSIKEAIEEFAQKAKEMNDIALGVDSMDASVEAVEYYSISGVKLNEPAAGQLNLIKYSNGTVKKVFVE